MTDTQETRRKNLRRFVDIQYSGNQSALARAIDPEKPAASFLGAVLNGRKPFGEKLAARIELACGLVSGQLSLPHSPLKMRAGREEELDQAIADQVRLLNFSDKQELLARLSRMTRGRNPKAA
jgi:hypothetical protein